MSTRHNQLIRRLVCCMAFAGALLMSGASYANAATPSQFLLAGHFGLNVNQTKVKEVGASQQERDVCTLLSGDECRPGENDEGGIPGGFYFPESVAVSGQGDVYVADRGNARIQEFDSGGTFILTFGWNVNKTKVEEPGASQQERDVCTAASGDECQSGDAVSGGGAPEELGHVRSIAVDQSTGDVYVLTPQLHRVEMFTGGGEFVWAAGSEVNETEDNTAGASEEEKNLCTAASHDVCKAGVESSAGSKAPDAFKIPQAHEFFGNLLAVGGPSDLLYAADEGRVQEINSSGEYQGEVSLGQLSSTAAPSAVAVDAAGDVFVGDPASPGVHEYDSSGQLQAQTIGPAGASTQVDGLALDAYGRLGILSEEISSSGREISGLLYSTSGTQISSFAPPSSAIVESHSLAFASASAPLPDELYVLEDQGGRQEVEDYEPVVAPSAFTCPLVAPATGTAATLCGEVDPNGVQTTGFFEYGSGSTPVLDLRTASAFEGSGSTREPMSFELSELEPNETYYYAAAAETTVNGRKIVVTGATEQFETLSVPQQILDQPAASFITLQTAVLTASLNPEHTSTSYHFEYGPCPALSGCAGVQSTPAGTSSVYGTVEDIQEVTGLAEATTYSYRLVTEREGESPIYGPEGVFTTAAMPVLTATTPEHGAQNVTATSAMLTGSVDPGGEPAVYRFELGVANGASTQYAIVDTGSTAAAPASVSANVSGLQPGIVYAYRITVTSAYGSATSEPSAFATAGLAALLTEPTPLAMLAMPKVTFPKLAAKHQMKCRHGFKRNKKGKCVKIKRHHAKKRLRRHKKK